MKPACLYILNLGPKRQMTSIQQRTCVVNRNLRNRSRLDVKEFGTRAVWESDFGSV